MLKPALLIIIATVNILVGLLVLRRDSKKLMNISFTALIWSMAGWSIGIAAFLITDDYRVAFFWAKFYYLFPILIGAAIAIYALSFPDNRKVSRNFLIITLCGAAILIVPLLSIRGFVTTELVYHDWGKEIVLQNVHYLFYAIYLFVTFGAAMFRMFTLSRGEEFLEAVQAKFFFYGFLIAGTFGIVFNLILPWLGNYRLIWAGPLFTSAFAISIAYSIIKHRMFDIRAVLARSMTYALALSVGILIYAVALFAAGTIFVNLDQISFRQWLVVGTLAFILAVTYAPAIKIFNKLTNKIFLRDAYETQDVLDKVSGVIVGNVNPIKIEKDVLGHIAEAIRPVRASFFLYTQSSKLIESYTIGEKMTNGYDIQHNNLVRYTRNKAVSFDDLGGDRKKDKEFFRKNEISVLSPLVTKNEVVGYIIFGQKRSGVAYSPQDISLINLTSNELAVALQNARRFEEIQSFNKTLQDKVTEATRELKVTNRKLIQLDEAKDEFISMASHQLRTPLTSIKGYLSMVVEGDLGEIKPQQERVLKDAFGSSQRMAYLIADFLNVSRIKTGKFMIEKHEVDLPQIVQEEIRQLEEMAESRDLKLIYEKPGVFPRVKLDENKTRQVMMNMVDNAIYYTPSGGTITIQLYALADEIIFKVVDTGIGVPKKEQHKLFTKFFRAGNAKKARPDGTGLGLFMAQKVVVEQGGAVIFESTEGKGSTFGFRFPLKKIKA